MDTKQTVALMKEIAPAIAEHVKKALEPLSYRILALEAQLTEMKEQLREQKR